MTEVRTMWSHFARRSHAPLSARLLQEGQLPEYFASSTGIPGGLKNHVWIRSDIYLQRAELGRLENAVNAVLAPNWTVFINEFVTRCYGALDILDIRARELYDSRRAESEPDSATLARYLRDWFNAYRLACTFVPVFRLLEHGLSHFLDAADAEHLAMRPPSRLSKEAEERANANAIASYLRDHDDRDAASPGARALINDHVQRFGWLGVRWYLGSPFTEVDIRPRVISLAKIAQERAAADNMSGHRSGEKWELLDHLTYLRTHRGEVINRAISVARPFLEYCAFRLEMEYHDLIFLFPDEVIRAIGGEIAPIIVARRRQEAFGSVLLDGKFLEDLAGADAVEQWLATTGKEILGEIVSKEEGKGERLLKGTTACRGKTTGTIRVVNNAADAAALEGGEILVTTMTEPAMQAAIERSSGIITDDGGLLCHAALVARELGKPTLIETRVATQLLTTGDVAELDCDAGFVRWWPGSAVQRAIHTNGQR
jgi:phosphohistidine swiveling domain-containing protein